MRVLVLVHSSLIPPNSVNSYEEWYGSPWKTEFDVVRALKRLHYEVSILGVDNDIDPIKEACLKFRPHVVFNLLEEFAGEAIFDQHIVSLLEMLNIKYTGCNPRGLILARDKALAKNLLSRSAIRTPDFFVSSRRQKLKLNFKIKYPVFVKSLTEDSSLGITRKSIVTNGRQLRQRLEYFHEQLNLDALVESYIDGRELYVGVLGNKRVETLPSWELFFDRASARVPLVATRRVKWDLNYRSQLGVRTGPAQLNSVLNRQLMVCANHIYLDLKLNGYARIDFRVDKSGELFFIEANPNPDIGDGDDFAASAESAGMSYTQLIKKIVHLGISWSPI